jgi:hypothetical protein
MEKTFFVVCMIVTISIISIFSKATTQKENLTYSQNRVVEKRINLLPVKVIDKLPDTLPTQAKEEKIVDSTLKKIKELRIVDEKVQPVELTNKMIKEKVIKDAKALTLVEAKMALEAAEVVQLKSELHQNVNINTQANNNLHQAKVLQAMEVQNTFEANKLSAIESKIQYQKAIELRQASVALKTKALTEINSHLAELKNNLVKQQAEVAISKATYAKTMETAQLKKISMTGEIISDMVTEGLIKNNKKLSFFLNNNELIINGTKQPAAVHKKFKDKYVKQEGWNLSYDNNPED